MKLTRVIGKAINSHQDSSRDEHEYIDKPIPTFERLKPHTDPEIESAIRNKIEKLRKEREVFLSGVRLQLTNDPIIRNYFIKRLTEQHGTHYLSVLDPH